MVDIADSLKFEPRRALVRQLGLPLLVILAACATEIVEPDPSCATDPSLCTDEPAPDTTAQYLAKLPSWDAFAQPDTVRRNTLNTAADTMPIVEHFVDSVPVFGDNGIEGVMENVRYVCQSKPYTISDTPEQLVMYDPNRSILYAGAFIQGKTHKDPVGSLKGLLIGERNPIRVSIPDLSTGENFREVIPNQAEVEAARGQMIGDAVANDLATPTSSDFEMLSYHSEKSFAIDASLSGKYLGFEATASGGFSRSVNETTLTAHYTEKMYTVVVEPPADGFFSDEFTNEVLAGHIKEGRIGPDNLPVYVSEVVYGRSMMFSVTSSASEQDIRSTLQASYDGLVGGGDFQLNQKQSAIMQNSRIAITSLGGPSEATAAMIKSGDWSQYFTKSAALSEAVPLSYTFTNLTDGSIAKVTEATEYTITECEGKPLVPGVFDFEGVQQITVPLTPGYQTYYGDVNGDQRGDMIFNYTSGNTNDVAVAFAETNGSFSIQSAHSSTVTPPEGWSLYDDVQVGDFNNDGKADLVWNLKDRDNVFYVALSNGNGTFAWGERQTHPLNGWVPYRTLIADVDNANGDDIVWNYAGSSHNRTYVGLSNGDGTFDLSGAAQNQAGTCCWDGTDTFIGDVTGDGFVDLIYSRTLESGNANWVAIGNGDGTFITNDNAFTSYGTSTGWADYKPVVGDLSGDQRADLVWIADGRPDIPIHRAIARSDGKFDKQPWQHIPDDADGTGVFEVRMGDVDADGDDDIILVDLDGTNNKPDPNSNQVKIWVGLGTSDQAGIRFDFKPVDQIHPAQDTWGQYAVHAMDINGDNKTDLVLHWNASPHNVYVALAK